MNKTAVIRTQLARQLKALSLFIIVYSVALGALIVVNEYMTVNFNFENISYLFVIYIAITSWNIFSKSLIFYSYHSYSRRVILNRTVIVELIVSFLTSLLIEGHHVLMRIIPNISSREVSDKVKNVYINQLTTNEGLRIVFASLLTTLAIFSLLQLVNIVLVAFSTMRRKNVLLVLIILAMVIFGVIFSIPFWNAPMISIGITILGFVFGTGQALLPSFVIPSILLFIIAIVSYLLSRKFVSKIEVHRNIFI